MESINAKLDYVLAYMKVMNQTGKDFKAHWQAISQQYELQKQDRDRHWKLQKERIQNFYSQTKELQQLDEILVHVRRLFGCSSQGVNDEILVDIHNLFDENQDNVTSNTLGHQLGDSNSKRKVTVKGVQLVFDEMPQRNLSRESKVKPIFEETWDSVASSLFVLRQDGEVMEAYHLFQKLPATNWCCGSKDLISGWMLELKVFSSIILFGSNSYIHYSIFCYDLGLRYYGLISWKTGIGTYIGIELRGYWSYSMKLRVQRYISNDRIDCSSKRKKRVQKMVLRIFRNGVLKTLDEVMETSLNMHVEMDTPKQNATVQDTQEMWNEVLGINLVFGILQVRLKELNDEYCWRLSHDEDFDVPCLLSFSSCDNNNMEGILEKHEQHWLYWNTSQCWVNKEVVVRHVKEYYWGMSTTFKHDYYLKCSCKAIKKIKKRGAPTNVDIWSQERSSQWLQIWDPGILCYVFIWIFTSTVQIVDNNIKIKNICDQGNEGHLDFGWIDTPILQVWWCDYEQDKVAKELWECNSQLLGGVITAMYIQSTKCWPYVLHLFIGKRMSFGRWHKLWSWLKYHNLEGNVSFQEGHSRASQYWSPMRKLLLFITTWGYIMVPSKGCNPNKDGEKQVGKDVRCSIEHAAAMIGFYHGCTKLLGNIKTSSVSLQILLVRHCTIMGCILVVMFWWDSGTVKWKKDGFPMMKRTEKYKLVAYEPLLIKIIVFRSGTNSVWEENLFVSCTTLHKNKSIDDNITMPPLKFPILWRTFLLGLIGFLAQMIGYKGVEDSFPTLAATNSHLIGAHFPWDPGILSHNISTLRTRLLSRGRQWNDYKRPPLKGNKPKRLSPKDTSP